MSTRELKEKSFNFGEWAELMTTVHGEAGMTAIVYGIADCFKQSIFNMTQETPILIIDGDGASGKTGIYISLMYIFGKEINAYEATANYRNKEKNRAENKSIFLMTYTGIRTEEQHRNYRLLTNPRFFDKNIKIEILSYKEYFEKEFTTDFFNAVKEELNLDINKNTLNNVATMVCVYEIMKNVLDFPTFSAEDLKAKLVRDAELMLV